MRRLILWDVDGTLLRAGGAGRYAMEVAIKSVVPGLEEVPRLAVGGLTDQKVLTLILEELGIEHIEMRLPNAIKIAEHEIAKSLDWIRREGSCLPGVRVLLERLRRHSRVRQTLLTGNLVKNAETKMRAFGLDRYLDLEVGAYGTDHIDRTELVPIALRRVRELRGETYEPDEVWVIGDTEHDLACARAGGVRCILVGASAEAICAENLGANAYFEDLTDTEAVMDVLFEAEQTGEGHDGHVVSARPAMPNTRRRLQ